MSIFGISDLTDAIRNLRHEIEMDREERVKERYVQSQRAADMGYSQERPMPDWMANPQQFNQPAPEPNVCIPQSRFDRINRDAKALRIIQEERDKAWLELSTLRLDAKIKQQQNLRLANRVNDLELQLKAALDGKANPGTAQGPSSEEEGRLPPGDEQAPSETGKQDRLHEPAASQHEARGRQRFTPPAA